MEFSADYAGIVNVSYYSVVDVKMEADLYHVFVADQSRQETSAGNNNIFLNI